MSKLPTLSVSDFPLVEKWLAEDAEEPVEKNQCYFHTIRLYTSKNELYLKRSVDSLIVSRIMLYHPRKGYGTKIFDEFEKYCLNKNISKLVIESAMTPAICNFAKKNRYTPVSLQGVYTDEGYFGNWEKTTSFF